MNDLDDQASGRGERPYGEQEMSGFFRENCGSDQCVFGGPLGSAHAADASYGGFS